MLNECLSMILEDDEEDHQKGEHPVHEAISESGLHLQSTLRQECGRLYMLDLAVDVDCNLNDQDGKDQVDTHYDDVARWCVDN